MTQEEKVLLVKDLCARLIYGIKVEVCVKNKNIKSVDCVKYDTVGTYIRLMDDENFSIKPYLRKMSSMTEEEKKELQKITDNIFYAHNNYISNSEPFTDDGEWHTSNNKFVTNIVCDKLISWLDEKHFDHRTDEEGKTLIEKGMALEAPDGMYQTKNVSPVKSNKLKECILNLKSNYLNDTVEWDIIGTDPGTNKIILKEHREYDRLQNGNFFTISEMVNLITTNTIACELHTRGYYWKKVYVDGKLFSDDIGKHIF